MDGNEASDRAPDGPRAEQTDRPRSGPVVELALVAAGLGLVVYLLGYVDGIGSSSSLIVALLLGGGLLAGSVALPTVGARMLAPAAVAALTGALLLLQTVVNGADSPVAIGALVLALLEAAAAGAAALLNAGVLRAPRPRARARKAAAPPPQPVFPPFAGQQYPGQQYPGQPYSGSYPGQPGAPYPGDQYAGEHAYAQYARYGAPYGVPGYPPPPPQGAPVYDPAAGRADVPPPGAAFGEQPTAVTATGGYRPGPASSSASSVPSAASSASSASRGEPGVVSPDVHGSGAYAARPAEPSDGWPARPSGSRTAELSGSHAVEPSGSHAAVPEGGRAGAPEAGRAAVPEGYAAVREGGHGAVPETEDERTRAIPRVSDDG